MALGPQEQIKKVIEKSREILIISSNKNNIDSIASMLALHLFLKKIDKKNKTVSPGPPPKKLKFLTEANEIDTDLKGAKDFIISLDVSHTRVNQFKYNIKNNKLNIYITPKGGYFSPHDVKTKKGKSKYDLIIVLNTPSLDNLGALYEDNAEIFYEAPLINIDRHSSNENFGEINLVQLTPSSTAEILFSLFQNWNKENIDPDIATCLLTGIIAETNSFRAHNTSPSAFNAAAQLVNLKAQRETIIQNLYKKKPLSSLKLWGRALARLKSTRDGKIIWSLLSQIDFEKSKNNINAVDQILEELRNNTTSAEIIFLLAEEKANLIHLKIQRLNNNTDLTPLRDLLLSANFAERTIREDSMSFVKKGGELKELEQTVLEKIKQILPK